MHKVNKKTKIFFIFKELYYDLIFVHIFVEKFIMYKAVYIDDVGIEMFEDYFLQYIRFKIEKAKKLNNDWKCIISVDYWGDNLLEPKVLQNIVYDKNI